MLSVNHRLAEPLRFGVSAFELLYIEHQVLYGTGDDSAMLRFIRQASNQSINQILPLSYGTGVDNAMLLKSIINQSTNQSVPHSIS